MITAISSNVYAIDESTNNSSVPTSFDLRDKINIKVENQGQKGWCNAYTYTKIVETYLQLTKGIDYNLSEAYMAYSNAPYFGGDKSHIKDIQSVNYYSVYER